MKLAKQRLVRLAFTGTVLLAGYTASAGIGSAFTYQGRLAEGGNVANGSYDLRFSLRDAVTGGAQVGASATTTGVAISNGFFIVTLDFGTNAFDGNPRWLEVAVRKGTDDFTVLNPRQPVMPVPYAIYAASADSAATATTAAGLSSALGGDKLSGMYTSPVTFSNRTNVFLGSFYGPFYGNVYGSLYGGSCYGDGNGLNNLNAAKLASGTVPDARLSANVTLLSASQVFTDTNRFISTLIATNPANQIAGTFTGNGAALTNLDTSAVNAATNALWIASTNWVMAQGYQTTNGLTRKAIRAPTPSNGTNYVVDFTNEVVQLAATNHITLFQSTNRPAAGWYGECVWYIQGGVTNRTLRVNTNWIGVGTLAATTPYLIASNKLTIVALSVRGSSETNVTYAIGRQD